MCGWEERKQMMQRMREKIDYFKMKENCTKIVGKANGNAI
jgi:hypothetical protein